MNLIIPLPLVPSLNKWSYTSSSPYAFMTVLYTEPLKLSLNKIEQILDVTRDEVPYQDGSINELTLN